MAQSEMRLYRLRDRSWVRLALLLAALLYASGAALEPALHSHAEELRVAIGKDVEAPNETPAPDLELGCAVCLTITPPSLLLQAPAALYIAAAQTSDLRDPDAPRLAPDAELPQARSPPPT